MYFMRVTKLLEIYSVMNARVGTIKKNFFNNFKMLKTTKKKQNY